MRRHSFRLRHGGAAGLRRFAAGLVWIGALSACTGTGSPNANSHPASRAPEASVGASWRALAPAPSERTEVAATVSGTRIYVMGGFRADGATVSTVEVLDVGAGRWEVGPDLPLAVNHAMAATVGAVPYVFGGYFARGGTSPAAYRLDGGQWRAVAQMPEGRAAGTAVAIGGTVYVAGGIGPGNGLADRMLVYDAAADRWSTADGPPTRREHLGGAGAGGLVYTVGGRTGAGNLAAFEVFDPASRQWTPLPAMPTPRGGLAGTATCTGQIVAIGGEAQATFAEAEMYAPATRGWTALPTLPTPRHGLGVVSVGTTLYTLAGGPKPGLFVSNATEAIDLGGLGHC